MAISIRHTPFPFAKESSVPAAAHLTPQQLAQAIRLLRRSDLTPFVRAYVQERTPAAFAGNPLLWESLRGWLGARCGVHAREIGLSGSAQVGFSIVPNRNWAAFDPSGSDLDLFVVNETVYTAVESEARRFTAINAASTLFAPQVKTVESLLRKRWLDVKHVPADHDRYPRIAGLKNDASIVIDRLKLHGFSLKPSSFRVYPGWDALGVWTELSYRHLSADAP